MFDEHLEGIRYRRFTIRKAIEALETTADGDSNDEEIQAGRDLADEVQALLGEIVAEQDPRDLLNEARAAADRMNFASRREALAGAAMLKDVFLDLDDLACSGRLPDEWVDGFVKREQKARDVPPKVVELNGDGDPVCPVCNTVDCIVAEVTTARRKIVVFSAGTVTLVKPSDAIKSTPAIAYQCAVCLTPVALPPQVVDAA
jgi:hypothetical protein